MKRWKTIKKKYISQEVTTVTTQKQRKTITAREEGQEKIAAATPIDPYHVISGIGSLPRRCRIG